MIQAKDNNLSWHSCLRLVCKFTYLSVCLNFKLIIILRRYVKHSALAIDDFRLYMWPNFNFNLNSLRIIYANRHVENIVSFVTTYSKHSTT
jgi:hypothetical protein